MIVTVRVSDLRKALEVVFPSGSDDDIVCFKVGAGFLFVGTMVLVDAETCFLPAALGVAIKAGLNTYSIDVDEGKKAESMLKINRAFLLKKIADNGVFNLEINIGEESVRFYDADRPVTGVFMRVGFSPPPLVTNKAYHLNGVERA